MQALGFLLDAFRRVATRGLPSPQATGPLVFLHIPKTAGCSVKHFLINRFAADGVCMIYPDTDEELARFQPAARASCYIGHIDYPFTQQRLWGQPRVFTVLREPIDRALSAFYFHRRGSVENLLRVGRPELVATQHCDLPEFIARYPEGAVKIFGNMQTGKLCGKDWFHLDSPLTRADLDRAKENLSRCLVGLVEQLEDSMALLCQEEGWPCPDRIPQANRTPDRPRVAELDARTRSWLEEQAALDLDLYRFGQELFQQWTDRIARRQAQGRSTRPISPRHFRLTFDQPIPGHGWREREQGPGGHFCWSEANAWLVCPAPAARRIRVEVETLTVLPPSLESPFTLRINEQPVELTRESTPRGARFVGIAATPAAPEHTLRLDFHVHRPIRPCDVNPESSDTRVLGLAVTAVGWRAA